MKIIMAILLVIAASVILVSCKLAEEEPAEIPVQPAPEMPVTEPAPQMPALVPGVMLSELQCVNGNVQGWITNVLNEEINTIKIRIIFNGMTVNPRLMGCDKAALMPGESTLCSSLQGVYPNKGTNVITIAMGPESAKETITC